MKFEDKTIVLFDGVCNLCQFSVNFIIDRDPKQIFQFASLQSEVGKAILGQHGEDAQTLDSVALLVNGQLYRKSSAALQIAKRLSWPWPILYIGLAIPSFLRDKIYDLIARHRYRWFGKTEECRIPTPALRKRFLEYDHLPIQ
jgi:predicted DCC family thiol-disulfide oxidoreductase YuxK